MTALVVSSRRVLGVDGALRVPHALPAFEEVEKASERSLTGGKLEGKKKRFQKKERTLKMG